MEGETIDVKTDDGTADAYLARPSDRAGLPTVLLMMDAFGLRAQIERMADRIAAWGFVVLAPNLYYRSGPAREMPMPDLEDPAQRGPFFERIRPLMEELTPERIVRDGAAYLGLLEELGRGPVAITGYCMGARLGWMIAAAHPHRVAALGAFHGGRLVTDEQDSPHLSAGALEAELYFGHADKDQSMTAENIATLERALEQAGVTYRSELYRGAAHGYTMADTAAYDEAAAERHFRELQGLLERTIAAG